MKFKDNMINQSLRLINRIINVCSSCGEHLSQEIIKDNSLSDSFISTALQFTRINIESTQSIRDLILEGSIAESFVLLRWHLEYSHLFYYLWKNESKYKEWKQGKYIRPKDIGKFFVSIGFQPLKTAYEDWSNVVHGNSIVVENLAFLSKRTPANSIQYMTAKNALCNLMCLSQKFNIVSGTILKDLIDISLYNPIAEEFNNLDDEITEFCNKQINDEKQLMNN